jgi:hypothetical protein
VPVPASRPRRPSVAPLLACLLGAAFPHAVRAQEPARPGVSVRLTYDPGARPGIAVLPVRGTAADVADSVRGILQRDLDFGDRVTVLGATVAASLAGAAGRVDYEAARRAGAAGIVEPAVLPTGALRLTLHDVAQRRVALVREVALPAALTPDWRWPVHAASDQAEQWATGVRGVAATRVLFVRDRRVWSVDSDGANARPLTDRGALSPAWQRSGAGSCTARSPTRGGSRSSPARTPRTAAARRVRRACSPTGR